MEKCDKCGEFIEFARLCPLCAHYEKERANFLESEVEEYSEKYLSLYRDFAAEKERADKCEEAHGHAIDILNKIGSMVKEVREIAEYDYSDYANGQVDLCNVIGNLVAIKCLLVAIEDTLSKKKEALGDDQNTSKRCMVCGKKLDGEQNES